MFRRGLAFAVDGRTTEGFCAYTQTTCLVTNETHEEIKIPCCSLLSYLLSRPRPFRLVLANILMPTGADIPASQERVSMLYSEDPTREGRRGKGDWYKVYLFNSHLHMPLRTLRSQLLLEVMVHSAIFLHVHCATHLPAPISRQNSHVISLAHILDSHISMKSTLAYVSFSLSLSFCNSQSQKEYVRFARKLNGKCQDRLQTIAHQPQKTLSQARMHILTLPKSPSVSPPSSGPLFPLRRVACPFDAWNSFPIIRSINSHKNASLRVR